MSKILVIDIETRPALAWVWGLYDQNIGLNQLVKPSSMMCFAAKWLGEKEIFFYSDWKDGHDTVVAEAYKLIDEADAVVGYNSDSFDLRKLQGEFLLAGFKPPAPVTSIDLLKSVKKLGFQSNKLAYIGPFLNIGGKTQTGGFELWTQVMEDNPAACKKMQRYNEQDVMLTEKLYNRVKAYIRNHPFMGERQACGACDGKVLHSRGYRRTKTFKIQRLQCQTCGSWQDGKREKLT